jgi:peptidoglycan/xylan/chitin deacetylase (PgdA/CDA1 family)
MKKKILYLILYLARSLGLFAISRHLTMRGLRILCYHGIALKDEHEWWPGTFMASTTFKRRMSYLSEKNYPVIRLSDAAKGLQNGILPPCATVITIDDGWYGTYSMMAPVLKKFDFPATLYIATYYLDKQTQVFNAALAYLLWRSPKITLDLSVVTDQLSGSYFLGEVNDREQAHQKLNRFAEELRSASMRQEFFRGICKALDISHNEIESIRIAAFMTAEEARDIGENGISLQLHTHRHRIPIDSYEAVKDEIEDNRRSLEKITNQPFNHFCYPSGNYTRRHFEYLKKLDVITATTCVHGLNYQDTNPYELKRYIDGELLSQIEFEAEMSGFFELVRKCGYKI